MKVATKAGFWAKMGLFGLFLALILGLAWQQPVQGYSQSEDVKVPIYFFWGDGCPHCAAAEPVLANLEKQYPQVELLKYEVWYDKGNQLLFDKMAKAYGTEAQGVPTIFLDDQYWIGWTDSIGRQIEEKIQSCINTGECVDAGLGIIPGREAANAAEPRKPLVNPQTNELTLPLIGTVDLGSQSLIASTLLISFVDGFNPCSLWVLTMLLALTLHTGSRKKVFLIGLIFLTVTALVYGLFITGLFTFLTMVSFMGWIQVVVAVVALFFAVVNIKDYFWYKEGISFTISDEAKPGIFQRMRRLMDASQSFWGLAGATVVLAAGVSLVEFSCTAGFPVVWTNLLTAQNVAAGTFVALLLVYLLIYQLDELAIFGAAVWSLKASRLEEKQGRILKLIGGMLMLTLSIVMLINPALMNNLSTSLLIFVIAFAAALLVLLVHRKILPAYGIWIGTEAEGRRKTKGKRQVRRAARH